MRDLGLQLNGNSDATGLAWIREAGLLTSPVAFTNTHSVGGVRNARGGLERQPPGRPPALEYAGGAGDL